MQAFVFQYNAALKDYTVLYDIVKMGQEYGVRVVGLWANLIFRQGMKGTTLSQVAL